MFLTTISALTHVIRTHHIMPYTCSHISINAMDYSIKAVERAGAISRQADIVAALSLEVLKGTTRAFDSSM